MDRCVESPGCYHPRWGWDVSDKTWALVSTNRWRPHLNYSHTPRSHFTIPLSPVIEGREIAIMSSGPSTSLDFRGNASPLLSVARRNSAFIPVRTFGWSDEGRRGLQHYVDKRDADTLRFYTLKAEKRLTRPHDDHIGGQDVELGDPDNHHRGWRRYGALEMVLPLSFSRARGRAKLDNSSASGHPVVGPVPIVAECHEQRKI
jgi:hypothetical protein